MARATVKSGAEYGICELCIFLNFLAKWCLDLEILGLKNGRHSREGLGIKVYFR
jgi:hypothetical protein